MKKRYFGLKSRILLVALPVLLICGITIGLAATNDDVYKKLRLLTDVISIIEKSYVEPVERDKLVEEAVKGMVSSLDPHSALLLPKELENLRTETSGEFGGVGIVITRKDGSLTVISPVEGTPAMKAGVQAQDIIIKIDGVLARDMTLMDAVSKIRGKKGTSVKLTVMRKEKKEPMDFSLVRTIIPLHSVKHVMLKPGYAYVRITSFQHKTTKDLKAALKKMESRKFPKKLKGLILDLRNNPGGLLHEAVSVADVFMDRGVILSVVGREPGDKTFYRAGRDSVKRDYPIVVLVNGGSASASEIVSGAFQDNNRAVIMGTSTFGKGSVQKVETLDSGYGLKLTVAKYYTPSGESIHAKGIQPDIVVAYKLMDDSENPEKNVLKEKDFHNSVKKPKSPKKKESKGRKGPGRHDGPKVERLMKDSQVKKAMDVLIGHNVFSKN